MRNRLFTVYGLKHPNNTKIRYVGVTKKSVKDRIRRHLDRLKLKTKWKPSLNLTHKENWLNTFVDNFDVNEVDYKVFEKYNSIKNAYKKEKELIKKMDNLTNIADGGFIPPSLKGKDHPHYGKNKEEIFEKSVLERMSKNMSGEKNPLYNSSLYEIWKDKYGEKEAKKRKENWKSNLSKSIKESEEFRKNRFSSEWSENMSKSMGMDVYIINEKKDIIKEFRSCTKASNWLGCTRGNVKNARRQKRKIQGKYYIVSVEDYHSDNFEL